MRADKGSFVERSVDEKDIRAGDQIMDVNCRSVAELDSLDALDAVLRAPPEAPVTMERLNLPSDVEISVSKSASVASHVTDSVEYSVDDAAEDKSSKPARLKKQSTKSKLMA